jgi:hypothetical protein
MTKIRFNKGKKQLIADVQDTAWLTPFQPHVLAEMLTAIYHVTHGLEAPKFEYFKEDGQWGFRAAKKK